MTPWAVLELSPGASATQIRTAFLRLAHRYHPDRDPSPGAHDRFVRLRQAYETLTDPARREGTAAWQGSRPPPTVTPAEIIAAARAAFLRELRRTGGRVTSEGFAFEHAGMRIVMTIG